VSDRLRLHTGYSANVPFEIREIGAHFGSLMNKMSMYASSGLEGGPIMADNHGAIGGRRVRA